MAIGVTNYFINDFMPPMNLTPNELVGYRIKPDYCSFNVVVVKRHGPTSNKAGEEYEKPLAYCSSIENATTWLVSHVTRIKGAELQEIEASLTGNIADAKQLELAMQIAVQEALKAVTHLQEQLNLSGLKQKDIVQLYNKNPTQSSFKDKE